MSLKELIVSVIMVALIVLCGVQLVKHNTYTYDLSKRLDQLELEVIQLDLRYSTQITKLHKQDVDLLKLLKGYQEQRVQLKNGKWEVKF